MGRALQNPGTWERTGTLRQREPARPPGSESASLGTAERINPHRPREFTRCRKGRGVTEIKNWFKQQRVAKQGVSGSKRRHLLQSEFKAKWRRLFATQGHLNLLGVVGRERRFRFSSDPQPMVQRKDNCERKT